ncbi:MAG: cupredoxin domain-containing protein [Actinobacteria bacterium]|nr:cupredoxin domain-containing protein [Actinomycetota bacterium]
MAADPEALYQEVLAEEQGKGVTGAVAEGRAKAARARAEHGSPHPKEPKWWPGAQPHLEGGDGAAPAAEADQDAVEEETAAAEAPVEEAAPPPAEPAPAPQPPDIGQEEARPVPDVPPEQPAATAPQPVAAAAATGTETRPSGVTHGTPTGNRLRPEDSVTTDVQLDAQQAVHRRRKLIDEVVATGVPQVAAAEAARSRTSPMMLLLYVLIPLVAVAFLVGSEDNLRGEEAAAEAPAGDEGGEGGGLSITAENLEFNTDTLEFPADEETELEFANNDAPSVPHNVAIYESEGGPDIFVGEEIPGGQTITYSVPAMEAGDYYFQCDVHPGMNGTVTVE